MAITLVDSEAVGFADGNAGHVYTFPAGAPSANDLDVLCVNSNTTVSTPSGFTARVTAVANQGSYIFTRKAAGGEASTVTITTSGDHNTTLTWSRWTGTDAYSTGSSAQANNSNNTVLPALSTGTLAATGMLVIAFGALHNHDGALATSPSWINSWTALEAVSQGTAGSSASCVAFTAYKDNAGTAAETVDSVSWTNNVRNRYALFVAFTATAGGTTYTRSYSGAIAPAGALTRSTSKTLAGSTTPSGAVVRQVAKTLSGAVTPVGALVRQAAKTLAGTVAPAGALTRQTDKALAGAVAPTGGLTKLVSKTLAGGITPSGLVAKILGRLFGGSIAPSGAVTTQVSQLRDLRITTGRPEAKWTFGAPETKWTFGQPEL